jgi:hypothetical protein
LIAVAFREIVSDDGWRACAVHSATAAVVPPRST